MSSAGADDDDSDEPLLSSQPPERHRSSLSTSPTPPLDEQLRRSPPPPPYHQQPSPLAFLSSLSSSPSSPTLRVAALLLAASVVAAGCVLLLGFGSAVAVSYGFIPSTLLPVFLLPANSSTVASSSPCPSVSPSSAPHPPLSPVLATLLPRCGAEISDWSQALPLYGEGGERQECGAEDDAAAHRGAHVLRPHAVPWPGRPGYAVVFDCWFGTPMTLTVVGFWHDHLAPQWGRDMEVRVDAMDGRGWQDVSARFIEQGQYPNGRLLTFHLDRPVRPFNNSVSFHASQGDVVQHHNLAVQSLLPITREAVHVAMFKTDLQLLPLHVHHMTQQGFTHFLWFHNGPVTPEVLSMMPPNDGRVVLMEWDFLYMMPDHDNMQQAYMALLTWVARRLLPHVEWVMITDLDEFPIALSGEPLLTHLSRRLPWQSVWKCRDRFAYVMNGWLEWMQRFAAQPGQVAAPLTLQPSASTLPCLERGKSIYHRSFLLVPEPIMGGHHPVVVRGEMCHESLEQLHVLNFRRGVTSGNIHISSFAAHNITLVPATALPSSNHTQPAAAPSTPLQP